MIKDLNNLINFYKQNSDFQNDLLMDINMKYF